MTPARIAELQAQAQSPHSGIFMVAKDTLELRSDTLPDTAFDDAHVVTASLGYCRCTSDSKAITLFSDHPRVPAGTELIALGHETVHVVLHAPDASRLTPGDFVLITPGHASTPIDPLTFKSDDAGVLAALGYSYRYFGALRPFNVVPVSAIDFVAAQGFGKLFNVAQATDDVSLASLAHAEPYACCFGANQNIFFQDADGAFSYNVPPRAIVAYLGGTARMAMINLTIVASQDDADLPPVVYITGSPRKLADLDGFALIQRLRERGTQVVLIDRNAPDILEQLSAQGRPNVVITNYPSQDVYDQAVAIIAKGGNINNYAGATDDGVGFTMGIQAVNASGPPQADALARIAEMHHNVAINDYRRQSGLAPKGTVALIGFDSDQERLQAFQSAIPSAHSVWTGEGPAPDALDDVFINGTGAEAATHYAEIEAKLNRGAAVNFVQGDTEIFVKSRAMHYKTRHQIVGTAIPFTMTNTSEPVSADLARQGCTPIDFDWLVRGISGLQSAIDMIDTVSASQAFGSFFTLVEIPDLPYVEVNADAMRTAASNCDADGRETAAKALRAAADVVEANEGAWSKSVEAAIYEAYAIPYPLA